MIEIQKNYKKLIELFRESDSYKKIISNNFAFSCRGANPMDFFLLSRLTLDKIETNLNFWGLGSGWT